MYEDFECFFCDDIFCDGYCEQALNAEQEDIERHITRCTGDDFCYICQCM